MKKIYTSFFVLLNIVAYSQHTIKGTIENGKNEPFMVYLKEFKDLDWNVIDSTLVQKNKFEFTLPENQEMIYLESNADAPEYLYVKLYNVKGTTSVRYDIKAQTYTLDGTSFNSGYSQFQHFIKPYEDKVEELSKNVPKVSPTLKQTDADWKVLMSFYTKVDQAKKALEEAKFAFIKNTSNNDYTDKLIQDQLKKGFDEKQLDLLFDFYNNLNQTHKQSPKAQKLYASLQKYETVRTGAKAPDFTAPTPQGTSVNLYKNLGKYTIIDFWASWCAPCRRENPNVVALYQKYKDAGLKIIGVSLDKDKNRWINAIEKDGLPWLHVSNLKNWEEPIAQLYKVNSVPKMFILDENGTIIARDLRGEELASKLEELFNK